MYNFIPVFNGRSILKILPHWFQCCFTDWTSAWTLHTPGRKHTCMPSRKVHRDQLQRMQLNRSTVSGAPHSIQGLIICDIVRRLLWYYSLSASIGCFQYYHPQILLDNIVACLVMLFNYFHVLCTLICRIYWCYSATKNAFILHLFKWK